MISIAIFEMNTEVLQANIKTSIIKRHEVNGEVEDSCLC